MPVGPFFADFLCRELKLIIEVDGHSHDVQPEKDGIRDRYLAKAGFCVVHFSNADVMRDIESVLTAIRSAVGRLAHP